MASQFIELFSGKVRSIDPQTHVIEVDLESEFGYPLAEDQLATYAIYTPVDLVLEVGQVVTQYLSTEIPDPQPRAWTPKAAALLLLDKLRREKPGDRSDPDRRYAIAITEAEKLAAYIMTYLTEEK